MSRRRIVAAVLASVTVVLIVSLWPRVVAGARIVGMRLGTPKSVADRVAEHGAGAFSRLAPAFDAAGVSWPPRRVLLVAFKEERRLDLFAEGTQTAGTDRSSGLALVKTYPVLAASGVSGPKLREGDRQVPEGLYPIESLNPMSRFHLALRVGYPNRFDRERAAEDGRPHLGGDIMVHGSDASIGCLAIGDEAAEELFVVAALAGVENVRILIAPCDLRIKRQLAPPESAPPWTADLWSQIADELALLPQHR